VPPPLPQLDPEAVYIIGGIVDRNRHKLLCYNKAEAQVGLGWLWMCCASGVCVLGGEEGMPCVKAVGGEQEGQQLGRGSLAAAACRRLQACRSAACGLMQFHFAGAAPFPFPRAPPLYCVCAQGIAHARLPIGDYIRLASSQVMTTNHVSPAADFCD
jgi:hypothetical protein